MSNELHAYATSGLTLYAVLLNSTGQLWNGSAFEAYNGANWTDYDIALTEAGAGIYLGNMPAVEAGSYSYAVYEQAGANPATTDTLRGTGYLDWDGSATFGNSALATLIGDVPTNAELGTALAAADDAVLAAIAGLGGSGSGSITFTYTLTSTEDGTAIPDAEVWVTARSTTTPVLASGRTNASGQVVFYLEAGLIDVWRRKSGWNFTNPDQEEVA